MVIRRHRRSSDVLAPALRRLDEVRVTVGDGPARAQVCGIGHRYRVAIPVSLALATRLVADGAPLHIIRGETLTGKARLRPPA